MKYWLFTHTCNGEMDEFVIRQTKKPNLIESICAYSKMDYNCQDHVDFREIPQEMTGKYRLIYH